ALVSDTDKGGPAEKAGIKRGDIIVELEGKKITDIAQLPRMVARMEAGKKVNIKIVRDNEAKEITAIIEKMGK
ncbi:MAG: PDZ domain-containing protein, partial [Nitrospirae bacterium]|nr:PDZ domain-containing protein [Nitrospirota bacterium]